jgi:hypothetical protein
VLLTSEAGGDDRHRSLRQAIAWSYRLFGGGDRNLFKVLSVFASWFDVDAALAVADPGAKRFDVPDALARLAEHSLLIVAAGEPTRYCALETIRQFGSEQLAELGLAIEETARRGEVMNRLALDASTAYHFNDYLLMASEIHLAAGQLRQAAEEADRLGELACYRDYPHPALARRVKVDAMAGDFEAAVTRGERFLVTWERAGRPISGTLNVSAYAVAMVHGLLGDEANRARWIEATKALMFDPALLATCVTGWAPTFDALLALDRDQPDVALERLAADIDDRSLRDTSTGAMWRPWYAALWVEAAVLAGSADAAARLERCAAATRENAIAAAIVERAGRSSAGATAGSADARADICAPRVRVSEAKDGRDGEKSK